MCLHWDFSRWWWCPGGGVGYFFSFVFTVGMFFPGVCVCVASVCVGGGNYFPFVFTIGIFFRWGGHRDRLLFSFVFTVGIFAQAGDHRVYFFPASDKTPPLVRSRKYPYVLCPMSKQGPVRSQKKFGHRIWT